MNAAGMIRVLLVALLLAPAAGAASSPEPAGVEPEAAATLKAALERLAAAKNLALGAEIVYDVPLPSGEKIQFSGTLDVAVRRPDRLRATFDGEPRATRSWYDGKTFTHFDIGGNAYASCAAPATLEGLFPTMREQLGFTPPLSMLLHENVAGEILAGVRSGYTVGRAVVRGVATRHLAFRGEGIDWQVWIAEEGPPAIARIVITYRTESDAPQYAATFTRWDFDTRLSDAEFAFTPPNNAVACEFQAPGK